MEQLLIRRLCHVCMRPLRTSINQGNVKIIPSFPTYARASAFINQHAQRRFCTKAGDPNKPSNTGEEDPVIFRRDAKGGGHLSNFTEDVKQREKTPKKDTGMIKRLLVSTIGLIALYLWLDNMKSKKEKEIAKRQAKKKYVDMNLVGGEWELVNQDGKTMSNKDFLGQWILMYFGFTHCPDICPDELEKVAQVVDVIGHNKDIPDVTPIFMTVDPERDTPEVIKEYLKEFSPKMIGFTGSPEQVKQVAKKFRVYHSSGPKDEDNDYIVDHTIIIYLLNPDGQFIEHYGRNATYLDVARQVEGHMKEYAEFQKK